jgi:hypothetical protein
MAGIHRMIVVSAVALGVAGAGLVGASVAQADRVAPYTTGAVITALPAKAALVGNVTPAEFVKVTLPVPTGVACATDMRARVVGQRNAVTVAVAPDCTVAGSATWTVTANAIGHKRHAVVKFISVNPADGSRTVGTLGVKVNAKARPAGPSAKPHPSGRPSPHATPRPMASASTSASSSTSATATGTTSASSSASASED